MGRGMSRSRLLVPSVAALCAVGVIGAIALRPGLAPARRPPAPAPAFVSPTAAAIRVELARASRGVRAGAAEEVERAHRSARDGELDAQTPSPEVIAAIEVGARTFVPTAGDQALDAELRAAREREVQP